MKSKIQWYLTMIIFCLIIIPACSKWDDYKKYIDEDKIYPQKPDSLKTRPGKNRIQLEWTLTDPKVTSCKILYSQEGILDSITVPVGTGQSYTNDTVRVIIDNLIESNCIFNVISYDDLGHSSLAVEAEGMVYGENYEKSLLNRTLRSKSVDNDGLHLQWYPTVDDTELGIELNYKDDSENSKTVFIADSIISNTIAGFNVNYPFTYRTKYLPTPTAIDTFYSPPNEDRITFTSELINTERPFQVTDRGWWFQGRFGDAYGWTVNAAAAQNATVDNFAQYALVLWSWTGYSPVSGITNGKIYQTLQLAAGTYSLVVTVQSTTALVNSLKQYIVANKGIVLPDVDLVETVALSWTSIGAGLADGTVVTCNFTLDEPSVISLGIVGSIVGMQELRFRKFELIKN
ncbi:DUF4998 domain-containing protein [uncultured Proteiniphilum sp.]|uniref:DUF4998 domain-containing protein n=1 Tax=uncultured Proteiniphilum sp. TaxID=497637 RepID=UPI002616011D|nr:DUF4998 domain-containing protein [uncultured Proteiniphilum sp.]